MRKISLLLLQKSKKYIMACVMSDKEVNQGAFRTTLAKVWHVEVKVVFKEVGLNKFLIELKDVTDKKRILNGRPWAFDKNLINIQDCEGVDSLKEMQFQYEAFWIQCHDLPFAGMNASTGETLGNAMG